MSLRQYSAQMYSVRPLDVKVRKDFVLKGDPYRHQTDAGARDAVEFLRSLGVVFWRDEFTPTGLLIQPDDADPTPVSERAGWLGYKSSLMLETDGKTFIRIAAWERPSPQIVRKNGDDRAWIEFNKPFNIVEMSDVRVQLA